MRGGDCIRSEVKLRYYRPEGLTNVRLQAVWLLKKQAAGDMEHRKRRTERQPEEGQNARWQKSAADSDAGLCGTAVQARDCADVTGRGLLTLGTIALKVPECENNAVYTLRFSLTSDNAEDIVNEYDIFIYEDKKDAIGKTVGEDFGSGKTSGKKTPRTSDQDRTDASGGSDAPDQDQKFQGNKPGAVYITSDTDTALEECGKGASVLLFVKPDSTLPDSRLKGEYCTDFWCYPMFRSISEGAGKPVPVGTMGLLIDTAHPALAGFACEEHTTAQWYQIVMHAQPVILDSIRETKDIKPIVRMMDNFERNHNLGLIYEVERENGKMLVCEADLLTLRSEYPEADCLYRSLVDYVQSEKFLRRDKQ